jgi:hypothetical protein
MISLTTNWWQTSGRGLSPGQSSVKDIRGGALANVKIKSIIITKSLGRGEGGRPATISLGLWCQWHVRDLGKDGRGLPAIEKVGPWARDIDFLNGEIGYQNRVLSVKKNKTVCFFYTKLKPAITQHLTRVHIICTSLVFFLKSFI